MAGFPRAMIAPVTVPCQESAAELAADSPELRLEHEPFVYCEASWTREFGAGS
jgi:hypothetical protein